MPLYFGLGVVLLIICGYILFRMWDRNIAKQLVYEMQQREDAVKPIHDFVLTQELLDKINQTRQIDGRTPLTFEVADKVAKWRASQDTYSLISSGPGGTIENVQSTFVFLVTYTEPLDQNDSFLNFLEKTY